MGTGDAFVAADVIVPVGTFKRELYRNNIRELQFNLGHIVAYVAVLFFTAAPTGYLDTEVFPVLECPFLVPLGILPGDTRQVAILFLVDGYVTCRIFTSLIRDIQVVAGDRTCEGHQQRQE